MKKLRYLSLVIIGIILGINWFPVSALSYETVKPQLVFSAINAGDADNKGEFIEIKKLSNESISLTGLSICYTNSSQNVSSIYDFLEGTAMAGESLLLRLGKKEDENADIYYSSSKVNLPYGSGNKTWKLSINRGKCDSKETEELTKIEWGGATENKSTIGKGVSLVFDIETETYSYKTDYEPEFTKGREVIITPGMGGGESDEAKISLCEGIVFSEIFSYFESERSEQFIEIYNTSSVAINLKNCKIRYKNKDYSLDGIAQPQEYFAYFNGDHFTLTKNPSNENEILLIDNLEKTVDTLVYRNGQKKGTSLALIGYDENGSEKWAQTFALTPGRENIYQEFKSCEDGKVLNEETGNCVNPDKTDTTLSECPEGSYRNPLTNRCKKIESEESTTLKDCAEGYERNPTTNRCRKIVTNSGENFAVIDTVSNFDEKSSFVALWAVIGISALGAGYVVFQYRDEIKKKFIKKK